MFIKSHCKENKHRRVISQDYNRSQSKRSSFVKDSWMEDRNSFIFGCNESEISLYSTSNQIEGSFVEEVEDIVPIKRVPGRPHEFINPRLTNNALKDNIVPENYGKYGRHKGVNEREFAAYGYPSNNNNNKRDVNSMKNKKWISNKENLHFLNDIVSKNKSYQSENRTSDKNTSRELLFENVLEESIFRQNTNYNCTNSEAFIKEVNEPEQTYYRNYLKKNDKKKTPQATHINDKGTNNKSAVKDAMITHAFSRRGSSILAPESLARNEGSINEKISIIERNLHRAKENMTETPKKEYQRQLFKTPFRNETPSLEESAETTDKSEQEGYRKLKDIAGKIVLMKAQIQKLEKMIEETRIGLLPNNSKGLETALNYSASWIEEESLYNLYEKEKIGKLARLEECVFLLKAEYSKLLAIYQETFLEAKSKHFVTASAAKICGSNPALPAPLPADEYNSKGNKYSRETEKLINTTLNKLEKIQSNLSCFGQEVVCERKDGRSLSSEPIGTTCYNISDRFRGHYLNRNEANEARQEKIIFDKEQITKNTKSSIAMVPRSLIVELEAASRFPENMEGLIKGRSIEHSGDTPKFQPVPRNSKKCKPLAYKDQLIEKRSKELHHEQIKRKGQYFSGRVWLGNNEE